MEIRGFPGSMVEELFELHNEFTGALKNPDLTGVEKYVLNPEYEKEVLKEELKNLKQRKDFLLREGTKVDIDIQKIEKDLDIKK